MKTKQVIITVFLLLAAFEVGAKGQDPPKSWQWLERRTKKPFTKFPEPYKVSNIDNIPSYMRSSVYQFEDDLLDMFYKDNGKKVAAVKKKDYDRYYISKYGQDFEVSWRIDKIWHPTIKDKSDRAVNSIALDSQVPASDTSKIIDLTYEFLNDMYNLKGVFYSMVIGNDLKDPKAKAASAFSAGGNWYGLQTGSLTLNTASDGTMSNSLTYFRPALNRSLSQPNFVLDIVAYEYDYIYSFSVSMDKSGKFFNISYALSCLYFHSILPEESWANYERDRREEYKLILNSEALLKNVYTAAKIKPVLIPIKKLLTR